MKNVLYFGLFVMALMLMTSCTPSTPGAAAKKYSEYLKSGDYDKFVDGIAYKEEQTADQKVILEAMLKEKASEEFAKKGGIKDIEIISEEISEDGNTAKVVLKQTYGNGESDEGNYDMVKKDGKWKMDMNK